MELNSRRIVEHLENIGVNYNDGYSFESTELFQKILKQYSDSPKKKTICVRIDEETRKILDNYLELSE